MEWNHSNGTINSIYQGISITKLMHYRFFFQSCVTEGEDKMILYQKYTKLEVMCIFKC